MTHNAKLTKFLISPFQALNELLYCTSRLKTHSFTYIYTHIYNTYECEQVWMHTITHTPIFIFSFRNLHNLLSSTHLWLLIWFTQVSEQCKDMFQVFMYSQPLAWHFLHFCTLMTQILKCSRCKCNTYYKFCHTVNITETIQKWALKMTGYSHSSA